MSCISLYKLEPDKLTTPFESAHQFTLAYTDYIMNNNSTREEEGEGEGEGVTHPLFSYHYLLDTIVMAPKSVTFR